MERTILSEENAIFWYPKRIFMLISVLDATFELYFELYTYKNWFNGQ